MSLIFQPSEIPSDVVREIDAGRLPDPRKLLGRCGAEVFSAAQSDQPEFFSAICDSTISVRLNSTQDFMGRSMYEIVTLIDFHTHFVLLSPYFNFELDDDGFYNGDKSAFSQIDRKISSIYFSNCAGLGCVKVPDLGLNLPVLIDDWRAWQSLGVALSFSNLAPATDWEGQLRIVVHGQSCKLPLTERAVLLVDPSSDSGNVYYRPTGDFSELYPVDDFAKRFDAYASSVVRFGPEGVVLDDYFSAHT